MTSLPAENLLVSKDLHYLWENVHEARDNVVNFHQTACLPRCPRMLRLGGALDRDYTAQMK
jgi:hypothetical protein